MGVETTADTFPELLALHTAHPTETTTEQPVPRSSQNQSLATPFHSLISQVGTMNYGTDSFSYEHGTESAGSEKR